VLIIIFIRHTESLTVNTLLISRDSPFPLGARKRTTMKTVIHAIIASAVAVLFIKKILKSSNCTP
jgi:hypothetical protein